MILRKSWGLIKEYNFNQVCTVRLLVMNPGESTSVHFHRLRDDMWVILDDGLEVQVGDRRYLPREGDEFVIGAGVEHCIRGGEKRGRVLEINYGYTTEDDIKYSEPTVDFQGSD